MERKASFCHSSPYEVSWVSHNFRGSWKQMPSHPAQSHTTPQSCCHSSSEAREPSVAEPLCHSSSLWDGSCLLLVLTEGSWAEPGRSRDGLSSRRTISQPLLVENSKSLCPQGKLSSTSRWGAFGSALTVAFVLTICYTQQVLANHAN